MPREKEFLGRTELLEKVLVELQREATIGVSPGTDGYRLVTVRGVGEKGKDIQILVSDVLDQGTYVLYTPPPFDSPEEKISHKRLRTEFRAVRVDWTSPEQWENAIHLVLTSQKSAMLVSSEDSAESRHCPFEHDDEGRLRLKQQWKQPLREDLWAIAHASNALRERKGPIVEPWNLTPGQIQVLQQGTVIFHAGGPIGGGTWIDRWIGAWLASESHHKRTRRLYKHRHMMLKDLQHFAFQE